MVVRELIVKMNPEEAINYIQSEFQFFHVVPIFVVFWLIYNNKKSKSSVNNDHLVNNLISSFATNNNLKVERVTFVSAKSVHEELSRNNNRELNRLVQGRLTALFVYDFFSCVNGEHLEGSSLIRGRVPTLDEYQPGGNFWWSGIQIHIVRNRKIKAGKKGSILGLYVFHDAYLSSYPGPNTYYHDVDPVLTKENVKKSKKNTFNNVGIEFNDEHTLSGVGRGSKKWCDIPILAGPGIGRFVLSHCIHTRCNTYERMEEIGKREKIGQSGNLVNFFVSVSGGSDNTRMHSLLELFDFERLHMSHPLSGDPWLDEAGDELFVLTRKGNIEHSSLSKILSSGAGRSQSNGNSHSRNRSGSNVRSKSNSRSKNRSESVSTSRVK